MVSLLPKPSQGTAGTRSWPFWIAYVHADVAFSPALLADADRRVCVVVDVLRATSSLATLFAQGAREVLVARTVTEARNLARAQSGYLLCGEEGGRAPEGFDFGNSPSEFAAANLRGARAILATTNGTPALALASGAPAAFAASLLNVTAAANAAQAEAKRLGSDILVVCSGDARGRSFSLEDAFCAGAIVDALPSGEPGPTPRGSAAAALRLYRSYEGSGEACFHECAHAASLRTEGFGADVDFCAQRDVYDLAPRLERGGDGVLRVVAG